MKVNMDDLLLAGLLDNDDELILLSQVCFGSDVPSFEKGFDLDTYTEEQSKASFRFYKDDIRNLCVELGIPRAFRARNGTVLSGEEGLCVLLKRLSYPNRLGDLSEIFGRSISELSYIFNGNLDFVDNAHSHLLTDLNQTWLSPASLQVFADAIHAGARGPWFEPHQRHILSKNTDSFPNHWLTTQEAVAPSQHD